MRDYLLDINIWEYWFNPAKQPEHVRVLKRVSELAEQCERTRSPFRVWISSVTWGELEYGYQVQLQEARSLETSFRQFIHGIAPKEFLIDKHVTHDYGRIRARLFEKYGPKEKKKKGLRPEQLVDPVTSLQLKIQENDLWIVSQAITRDFIFVTNDSRSLRPIVEVAGNELHVEYWAEEIA